MIRMQRHLHLYSRPVRSVRRERLLRLLRWRFLLRHRFHDRAGREVSEGNHRILRANTPLRQRIDGIPADTLVRRHPAAFRRDQPPDGNANRCGTQPAGTQNAANAARYRHRNRRTDGSRRSYCYGNGGFCYGNDRLCSKNPGK